MKVGAMTYWLMWEMTFKHENVVSNVNISKFCSTFVGIAVYEELLRRDREKDSLVSL
jgi:hypothetical protein